MIYNDPGDVEKGPLTSYKKLKNILDLLHEYFVHTSYLFLVLVTHNLALTHWQVCNHSI